MRITRATTSNNEKKINRLKNLRIFLPWKYKRNARKKVRKITFLEKCSENTAHSLYVNSSNTHAIILVCTIYLMRFNDALYD